MLIPSDQGMVLLKSTLVGIILLVVGILSITLLGQYVTMEVQQTQRQAVEPHVEFLVGDTAERSYTLPADVEVFGTIMATQVPSNQSGEIQFIVLDDANYQKWVASGQADSLYSTKNQGQFNYTFTTNKNEVYHFVFDNRASLYKEYVSLSVAYDEVLTSRVPDTRLVPVGWGLIVVGALALVYGLARKAPIVWAENR